jgi:dolichol-phosphate mannosyltransferase
MSIKIGFLMSFFSFLYLIYLIFRKLFLDIQIGWTSIMVSIFLIGGLVFANLGLIGLYIGKIYDEIKNRPLYVVREVIGEFKQKPNA